MNKLYIPLMTLAAALATLPAEAQQLKPLTLEATSYGGRDFRNLYPYDLSSWPVRGADDYLYYDRDYALHHANGSPAGATHEQLASLTGSWASICAVYPDRLWAQGEKGLFLIKYSSKTEPTLLASVLRNDIDDVRPGNDPAQIAFAAGLDLFLANDKGAVTPVNKQSQPGIRWGQTVHRSEFGIEHGVFWAPDGKSFAFYRKDEQLVTSYPLVDVKPDFAQVVGTKYPMTGSTSEQVTVGVYRPADDSIVWLETDSPVDRYFTNISWSTDARYVSLATIDRAQQNMSFEIYNAATGKLHKRLFSEHDDKWIEPCEPAVWLDPQRFAWLSYRDGFRHLYLYNISSGSCEQLTKGPWCVTRLYGYDARSQRLVLQTNQEGYLYRDIVALDLKGRMTRLCVSKTVAEADYLDGHSGLMLNESAPTLAKRSAYVTLAGQARTIEAVQDPYRAYVKPTVMPLELTSADGAHKLGARIILPPNFDEHKKYPVIIYLYGGPHHQEVNGGWLYGARPVMLYWAQEGYIVFSMDNRGSEMRGSSYEQCVHRQLGVLEAQDQMKGIDYLRSLPYVDDARLGIHGWSFGGFMTINMLERYPDALKVGVAGGPVCDWHFYEVMYGERYMDTPAENPEGYKQTSLLERVGDLKARLLVIQGAMDSTVVWQNSLRLVNAAIDKGKFIDMAVFPSHPHGVSGHDNVHCDATIKRYFDDFL